MKTTALLALLFLLTACDTGSGSSNENPLHLPPLGFIGDSIKGEVLFRQKCEPCHGDRASGTHQGPPLVNKIYNPNHHADLAFHLAVKNGVRSHHWKLGDMKAMPGVTPETVGHIIQYVRKLQRQVGIH